MAKNDKKSKKDKRKRKDGDDKPSISFFEPGFPKIKQEGFDTVELTLSPTCKFLITALRNSIDVLATVREVHIRPIAANHVNLFDGGSK